MLDDRMNVLVETIDTPFSRLERNEKPVKVCIVRALGIHYIKLNLLNGLEEFDLAL
jgi:hypothetical protein